MEHQCQSSPPRCASGCGFYDSAATNNFCSKCYALYLKDHRPDAASPSPVAVGVARSPSSSSTVQETAASAAASSSSSSPIVNDQQSKRPRNRCGKCNKKTGLVSGLTFCCAHRYLEEHGCQFDFKNAGRAAIAESNPLVKADKLDERI